MRFIRTDTVTFIDASGTKTSVKDLRLIETLETRKTIKLRKGDMLDEISNRIDVFGKNSENQIYKLFDHNIVLLTESRFNIDKLKELKIPV